MLQDIIIQPSQLTDGSKVYAVVYTGFVNGFQNNHTLTFHMASEEAAKKLEAAMDDITGVEVELRQNAASFKAADAVITEAAKSFRRFVASNGGDLAECIKLFVETARGEK